MLSNLKRIQRLDFQKFTLQLLTLLTIISSTFMIWKSLAWYTNTKSPVIVILAGGMDPTFKRGELLFLSLSSKPLEIGESVVLKLPGREIPIVHRVLKLHFNNETKQEFILTKGDGNAVNDRGLYDPGQIWLERHHIIGRVNGHLPYIGMVTIILNDYPKLKVALLAFMTLYVLSVNEEKCFFHYKLSCFFILFCLFDCSV